MIKDSPNPPLDLSLLHDAAHRAINHHMNPPERPEHYAESHGLFTVREGLDMETLLVNASEDLASVQALASHLAFDVEGAPRSIALGICRVLEGIQLVLNEALNQHAPATQK
ncbi:hypothetical protein AO262_21730 [Pseudomonas fluorescens ABAC62]|nr:hypothetical protein AO262_21730 [Pseudomonas fluorescens ABAC62]